MREVGGTAVRDGMRHCCLRCPTPPVGVGLPPEKTSYRKLAVVQGGTQI